MQNKPLVSICTPVYRVERYIEECVLSVLDQTYTNIELLLVDDCGGDHSIELAEQVLKANLKEGFTYQIIQSERNEGVSAARNKAMRAATGKYIFFLDSDDRLLPSCIEKLVARAEETNADVVLCDHISDDKADSRGGHMCAPLEVADGNEVCIHALEECWFNVATWCKLMHRSFIEQHQLYFINGIINEDVPWSFRLAISANHLAFVNEPLLFYRYNENSIMSASKQQKIIDSSEVALHDVMKAILERPDLWQSKDIYLMFMRQIDIFFAHVYHFASFSKYVKKIKLLKTLRYDTPWLKSNDVPVSYRVWNKMIYSPTWLAAIVTYTMLKIQDICKNH